MKEEKNVSQAAADGNGQPQQASTDARQKTKKLWGEDRFSLKDSPGFGIAVAMLFTLGIVLLPGYKLGALLIGGGEKDSLQYIAATDLGNALFRIVGFAVMVLLACDLGFAVFGFKGRTRGFLLALPFLLVAVNNLPIVGLCNGTVAVSCRASDIVYFAFFCLSVGLFEEMVFRGIVLPLLLRKMQNTRKGVFWAVCISSVLFGAVHLVNLLSGFDPAVFLQVGYSALIGAMCAMVMVFTRNVFACAFLHAGFNFCGLLADTLGSGVVWGAASVVLTAVVGVAAAAYAVYLLCRRMPLSALPLLYGGRQNIEAAERAQAENKKM